MIWVSEKWNEWCEVLDSLLGEEDLNPDFAESIDHNAWKSNLLVSSAL